MTVLFALSILSCSGKQETKINSDLNYQNHSDYPTEDISTYVIPGTNVSISRIENWSISADNEVLISSKITSSTITAKKSEINHIASPNLIGLEKYLEEKYPLRNYQHYELNGIKGLRAELLSLKYEKNFDIYLISEQQDFIHIYSNFKNGLEILNDGETIIATLSLKLLNDTTKESAVKNRFFENDIALTEGEFTLITEGYESNNNKSGFSFKSSSINSYSLASKDWDIKLDNPLMGKARLALASNTESGSIGEIIELNDTDITKINKTDFPDPNLSKKWANREIELSIGKTYAIYHHKSGINPGSVYGVIKLLELDKNGNWARFKFRRIYAGKPEHFQKWNFNQTLEDIENQFLVSNENYFVPRGYATPNDGNQITFNMESDTLEIKSNPYGNERGFYNLGDKADLKSITLQDIESKSGKFVSKVDIKLGDVLAVYIENYNIKTIFLMVVTSHTRGHQVNFDSKYLLYAFTKYSKDDDQ